MQDQDRNKPQADKVAGLFSNLVISAQDAAKATQAANDIKLNNELYKMQYHKALYRWIITFLALLWAFLACGGSYILYRLVTGGIF